MLYEARVADEHLVAGGVAHCDVAELNTKDHGVAPERRIASRVAEAETDKGAARGGKAVSRVYDGDGVADHEMGRPGRCHPDQRSLLEVWEGLAH